MIGQAFKFRYDSLASNALGKYANLAKTGELDINTALRQANDAADNDIQAAR
jgi:hypothetical protein